MVLHWPTEDEWHVAPPGLCREAVGLWPECARQRQSRATVITTTFQRLEQRIEALARITRSQAPHPEHERILEPERLGDAGVAKFRARREDRPDAVGHDVHPGRVEVQRRDRLLPRRLADRDDPGARPDRRGKEASVQATRRPCRSRRYGCAPHLDVVDGHHLAAHRKAEDRLATKPVNEMRVAGHGVREHMRLRAQEPRRSSLAPRR
jgi:hypothetical protein